jgi:hypothetical protein
MKQHNVQGVFPLCNLNHKIRFVHGSWSIMSWGNKEVPDCGKNNTIGINHGKWHSLTHLKSRQPKHQGKNHRPTYCKSLTNFSTWNCMEYISPQVGIKHKMIKNVLNIIHIYSKLCFSLSLSKHYQTFILHWFKHQIHMI